MPNAPDDPLSSQNIKDRYYGVNDPVADKMMRRAATMPKLETPSDKTVTTLYVGGLDNRITEKDLRFVIYPQYYIDYCSQFQVKFCCLILNNPNIN